ncbi:MAG: hypothetical protein JWO82_1529 [Akkermansiaceae bacterium]|nr:hypothetical protein [Akkermansiaceae bacterium]
MKNFRDAFLGFIFALVAVMVFGAQHLPVNGGWEAWFFYGGKCIPEALFAPLFFPLAMCYTGFGFSAMLLGSAAAVSPFAGNPGDAVLRALIVGIAFWLPWLAEAPFVHAGEPRDEW